MQWYDARMKMHSRALQIASVATLFTVAAAHSAPRQMQERPTPQAPAHPIVLHAARLLDVASGKLTAPGEILVDGDKIKEVSSQVTRPAGAEVIDLGDTTLLP